jgi:hypothetical protein
LFFFFIKNITDDDDDDDDDGDVNKKVSMNCIFWFISEIMLSRRLWIINVNIKMGIARDLTDLINKLLV